MKNVPVGYIFLSYIAHHSLLILLSGKYTKLEAWATMNIYKKNNHELYEHKEKSMSLWVYRFKLINLF
jgi:hypothetical protein